LNCSISVMGQLHWELFS